VAIAVLAAFLTPFRRDLFVGDETKYGEVIREMRISGQWFVPTLEGAPFTHKPPLHFWLIDLLTVPLGLYSTWAFVLPSLIAFIVLLWVLRRMTGDWLASFVCATSLLVWASAQSARMDVSFTLFLTIGAWMLFRFFEHAGRRALWLSALAFGIATLIKGLMAPLIALALFAFEWWRRKRVPSGNYGGALVTMIAVPLLWFVPAVILEGQRFVNEIVMKQTVGRAVGSWVHQSPPWFYVLHSPGTLFPWFLLFVVALWSTAEERGRRSSEPSISWILAVVVPYSLISSKLDVYMMAMVPPMAIVIGDFVRRASEVQARRGRIANAVTMAVLFLIGCAGPFVRLRGEDAALMQLPAVKGLFITVAIAAAVALIVAWRSRSLAISTLCAGLVPIVAFAYVAIALMPTASAMATTRPLIAALDAQHVDGSSIALYTCPHLWSRDMPRNLEQVRYVSAGNIGTPAVIATSRKRANEIASTLQGYHRVAEVRMIGKWFDVYRN
jgi:4-amino-4-deoxy-L-arabinose transferase-like glycosyltransferase